MGNSLVFPFIAIYLAKRLGAPLPVVGMVLFAYGITQVFSVQLGGLWSDLFGRRRVMLVALGSSMVVTAIMGFLHIPVLVITFLILMGYTVPLFQPAAMAMVGDLVEREHLNTAYSLMRMASNAGIIIGPMLGGFLADFSFSWIFFLDAFLNGAFFLIIWFRLSESFSPKLPVTPIVQSLISVTHDRKFLRFSFLWALTGIVYSQLFMVLPSYMHLNLGLQPSSFGFLAAENALFVVILQMPTSRLTKTWRYSRVMPLALSLYAFGFFTASLNSAFMMLAMSVAIITLGENLINPHASTWVSDQSSPDTRGRYMGFFSLSNRIGFAFGPLLGNILLSQNATVWLWTTSLLGLVTAFGYYRLFSSSTPSIPVKISS